MPGMILTKASKVRGEHKPRGHRFEASDKEAHLWRALGHASDVPAEAVNGQHRQQPAASDRQETSASGTERRQRYNRRDMRAED